jgi:hypothetical protein
VFLVVMGHDLPFGQRGDGFSQTTPIGTYLRSLSKTTAFHGQGRRTIAFLLRFEDFGCLACFESFLELADSAGTYAEGNKSLFAFSTFPGGEDEKEQRRLLTAWARANNIGMPILIVPEQKYVENGIDYSTVVLFDTSGTVLSRDKLPLSPEAEKRILHAFHSR